MGWLGIDQDLVVLHHPTYLGYPKDPIHPINPRYQENVQPSTLVGSRPLRRISIPDAAMKQEQISQISKIRV